MAETPSDDLRDAMNDAEAGAESADAEADGEQPDEEQDAEVDSEVPEGAVAQRIRGLRNRLRERRVRSRSKQAQREATRQRRKQRLREALLPGSESAREEASSEIAELAEETGVTRDRARGLIEQARTAASEAGDSAALDIDDDGDVDLLAGGGGSVEAVKTRQEPDVFEPPVGEVEDDLRAVEGVEEELGLDGPIEEDFDGLFR